MGSLISTALLLFFVLYQTASVLSSIYLSKWTEDPLLKNGSLANTTAYHNRQDLFLGIYGGLNGAQGKITADKRFA